MMVELGQEEIRAAIVEYAERHLLQERARDITDVIFRDDQDDPLASLTVEIGIIVSEGKK